MVIVDQLYGYDYRELNFQICAECVDTTIAILSSSNRINACVKYCDTGSGSHTYNERSIIVSCFYSLRLRKWFFTNDERRRLVKYIHSVKSQLRAER